MRPIDSFSKIAVRLISRKFRSAAQTTTQARLCIHGEFPYPTGKRCDEENNTDEPDPDGDQAPKINATPMANAAGNRLGVGSGVWGVFASRAAPRRMFAWYPFLGI